MVSSALWVVCACSRDGIRGLKEVLKGTERDKGRVAVTEANDLEFCTRESVVVRQMDGSWRVHG